MHLGASDFQSLAPKIRFLPSEAPYAPFKSYKRRAKEVEEPAHTSNALILFDLRVFDVGLSGAVICYG